MTPEERSEAMADALARLREMLECADLTALGRLVLDLTEAASWRKRAEAAEAKLVSLGRCYKIVQERLALAALRELDEEARP
jgi:predicted xylose isomerase-like sugar epimerase